MAVIMITFKKFVTVVIMMSLLGYLELCNYYQCMKSKKIYIFELVAHMGPAGMVFNKTRSFFLLVQFSKTFAAKSNSVSICSYDLSL